MMDSPIVLYTTHVVHNYIIISTQNESNFMHDENIETCYTFFHDFPFNNPTRTRSSYVTNKGMQLKNYDFQKQYVDILAD